jgi:hypothetical protein
MRNVTCTITILAALLFAGCGRAKVQTDIRADGSWQRTVSYTGSEKKEGSMQMGASIDEVFAIPNGAPWKSSQKKKDDNLIITVERTVGAGETVKADVALKGGDAGKLSFSNEAKVTRNGRRIEYTETLRWIGDRPKDFGQIKPADLAELTAVLPPALRTEANARALADRTAAQILPVMFGPGDPLLAVGILHPDLAERRISQRIGVVMMKSLEEQFGDKLKPAERQAIVRKLIEKGMGSTQPSKPDPAAGPPDKSGGSAGLTPLMFIVKMPGRMVSHNGTLDDLTGEVYWALFPEAAVLKEITLTAVCEVVEK